MVRPCLLVVPFFALACTPDGSMWASGKALPGTLDSDLLQDNATLNAIMAGEATIEYADHDFEPVARVQQALYDLELLDDTVDGWYGGHSEDAVEALQDQAGLEVTGVVDRATLSALDDAHARFQSRRFWRQPVFAQIMAGDEVLERGSRDKDAVGTLQATLYSLGYDLGPWWIDEDFGGATETALAEFQADQGLGADGVLGAETLVALDDAAREQLEDLQMHAPTEGSRADRYELWADIASRSDSAARNAGLSSSAPMVLWVIDLETDTPVAGYLTSPGRPGHETQGDVFHVQSTQPREWWIPTPSMENATTQPPGLDNPMGILKMHFLQYYQAIHGTPKYEWEDLGAPASSGCLRVSGVNILDLHEHYAESGTMVIINRDAQTSVDLIARAEAAGITVADIEQGAEYIGAYAGAELGRNESWSGSTPYKSWLDADNFQD